MKNRSQVFPLNGATVYEHVSRAGEVTYPRDPGKSHTPKYIHPSNLIIKIFPPSSTELEARALKIYSPDGPRNGVVIIFLTQSNKSLWATKISETISNCTPDVDNTGSPLTPRSRLASSLLSLNSPVSPSQPVVGTLSLSFSLLFLSLFLSL